MAPNWLPSMYVVTGNEAVDVDSLWGLFFTDFVTGRPTLESLNVAWNKELEPESVYHRGFIHMITRVSEMAGARRFDDFRAERLPWCRPMLQNCACDTILKWDYEEGRGRVHTYVWLQDYNYVVVLWRKKTNYFYLVTAHHIDGPDSKRKLHQKYKKRIGA